MIHFKRKTPKISLPLYMYDRLMDNDGIRFDTEVVCETKARDASGSQELVNCNSLSKSSQQ